MNSEDKTAFIKICLMSFMFLLSKFRHSVNSVKNS